MIRAVGIGAGDHARVILDCLSSSKEVEIVGLLDRNTTHHGKTIGGVPVLGGDDQISRLDSIGVTHAFIGVGGFGDSGLRRRIFETLVNAAIEILSVIHPSSVVSSSASLGKGVTLLAGSVVGCDAIIEDGVILNTNSSIDHDCAIGAFSHLAPGSCLAGRVRVGPDCHIGTGASIANNIKIGASVIIGAGAVVVNDLTSNNIYVGNPVRPISAPTVKSCQ